MANPNNDFYAAGSDYLYRMGDPGVSREEAIRRAKADLTGRTREENIRIAQERGTFDLLREEFGANNYDPFTGDTRASMDARGNIARSYPGGVPKILDEDGMPTRFDDTPEGRAAYNEWRRRNRLSAVNAPRPGESIIPGLLSRPGPASTPAPFLDAALQRTPTADALAKDAGRALGISSKPAGARPVGEPVAPADAPFPSAPVKPTPYTGPSADVLRGQSASFSDQKSAAAQRNARTDFNTEKNRREQDFRSKGVVFYTDANGMIQPQLDPETGRVVYREAELEPRKEEKTGIWYRRRRNRLGDIISSPAPLRPSADPADPMLYYDLGDGRTEVAGHTDDILSKYATEKAAMSNPALAEWRKIALKAREVRTKTARDEAIKPLAEAKDASAATVAAGKIRADDLRQQAEALGSQIAEIDNNPAASARTGGTWFTKGELTEEARRLQSQRSQLQAKLDALQSESTRVASDLEKAQTVANRATTDLDLAKLQSKGTTIQEAIDIRREYLRSAGRDEASDPYIANLVAQATKLGEFASEAAQARAEDERQQRAMEEGAKAAAREAAAKGLAAVRAETHGRDIVANPVTDQERDEIISAAAALKTAREKLNVDDPKAVAAHNAMVAETNKRMDQLNATAIFQNTLAQEAAKKAQRSDAVDRNAKRLAELMDEDAKAASAPRGRGAVGPATAKADDFLSRFTKEEDRAAVRAAAEAIRTDRAAAEAAWKSGQGYRVNNRGEFQVNPATLLPDWERERLNREAAQSTTVLDRKTGKPVVTRAANAPAPSGREAITAALFEGALTKEEGAQALADMTAQQRQVEAAAIARTVTNRDFMAWYEANVAPKLSEPIKRDATGKIIPTPSIQEAAKQWLADPKNESPVNDFVQRSYDAMVGTLPIFPVLAVAGRVTGNERLEKYANDTLAFIENRGDVRRDEKLQSALASGVGSVAGFVATGGITTAAARNAAARSVVGLRAIGAPTLAKAAAPAVKHAATFITSGAQSAAATMRQLDEAGVAREDQWLPILISGGVTGLTETTPYLRTLDRYLDALDGKVKGEFGRRLTNYLTTSVKEAAQESTQQIADNAVAVGYNPTVEGEISRLFEGLGESALVGGIVGAAGTAIPNEVRNAVVGLRTVLRQNEAANAAREQVAAVSSAREGMAPSLKAIESGDFDGIARRWNFNHAAEHGELEITPEQAKAAAELLPGAAYDLADVAVSDAALADLREAQARRDADAERDAIARIAFAETQIADREARTLATYSAALYTQPELDAIPDDAPEVDAKTGQPVPQALAERSRTRDAATALAKIALGAQPEELTTQQRSAVDSLDEELGVPAIIPVNGVPIITDVARQWLAEQSPTAASVLLPEAEILKEAAAAAPAPAAKTKATPTTSQQGAQARQPVSYAGQDGSIPSPATTSAPAATASAPNTTPDNRGTETPPPAGAEPTLPAASITFTDEDGNQRMIQVPADAETSDGKPVRSLTTARQWIAENFDGRVADVQFTPVPSGIPQTNAMAPSATAAEVAQAPVSPTATSTADATSVLDVPVERLITYGWSDVAKANYGKTEKQLEYARAEAEKNAQSKNKNYADLARETLAAIDLTKQLNSLTEEQFWSLVDSTNDKEFTSSGKITAKDLFIQIFAEKKDAARFYSSRERAAAAFPDVSTAGTIPTNAPVSPANENQNQEEARQGQEGLLKPTAPQEATSTPPSVAASAPEGVSPSLRQETKLIREKWKSRGVTIHVTDNNQEIQLGLIAVDNDKQGSGLGAKALDDVKDLANRHKKPVTLIALADTGKQDGLERFYTKNGFKKTGEVDPNTNAPIFRYEPEGVSPSAPASTPAPAPSFRTDKKPPAKYRMPSTSFKGTMTVREAGDFRPGGPLYEEALAEAKARPFRPGLSANEDLQPGAVVRADKNYRSEGENTIESPLLPNPETRSGWGYWTKMGSGRAMWLDPSEITSVVSKEEPAATTPPSSSESSAPSTAERIAAVLREVDPADSAGNPRNWPATADSWAGKVAAAIDAEDADALREMVGHGRGFNDSTKTAVFSVLGIPKPKTKAGIEAAIDEWAGVTPAERARRDAQAGVERNVENARQNLQNAEAELAAANVVVDMGDGSTQPAREYVENLISAGYTKVEKVRGRYALTNRVAGKSMRMPTPDMMGYARARIAVIDAEQAEKMAQNEQIAENQGEATPTSTPSADAPPAQPAPSAAQPAAPAPSALPEPVVFRGKNTPARFVSEVFRAADLTKDKKAQPSVLDFTRRLHSANPQAFADMEVRAYSEEEWSRDPGTSAYTPDSSLAYNPETNTLYLRRERVKDLPTLVSGIVHEAGHFAERYALDSQTIADTWNALSDEQIVTAAKDYNPGDTRTADEIRSDPRARSEWVAQQFARVVTGRANTVPQSIRAKLMVFFKAMKAWATKYLGGDAAASAALDREILRVMQFDEAANPVEPEVQPEAPASIGTNAEGAEVFQDARGVRSVLVNGIRREEPVGLRPVRNASGGISYAPEIRSAEQRAGTEFEIAEEAQARAASEQPAPADQKAPSRFEQARQAIGRDATVASIIRDVVLAREDVRNALKNTPKNAIPTIEDAVREETGNIQMDIAQGRLSGDTSTGRSWLGDVNTYTSPRNGYPKSAAEGILAYAKRKGIIQPIPATAVDVNQTPAGERQPAQPRTDAGQSAPAPKPSKFKVSDDLRGAIDDLLGTPAEGPVFNRKFGAKITAANNVIGMIVRDNPDINSRQKLAEFIAEVEPRLKPFSESLFSVLSGAVDTVNEGPSNWNAIYAQLDAPAASEQTSAQDERTSPTPDTQRGGGNQGAARTDRPQLPVGMESEQPGAGSQNAGRGDAAPAPEGSGVGSQPDTGSGPAGRNDASGGPRDLRDLRSAESAPVTPEAHAWQNYRITPADRLGEGGLAQKHRDNLAAIRTLKQIEASDRLATAAEKAILVRYVGWGGLKSRFNPDSKDYSQELRDLLTEEEYAAARRSVQDAHYTSPTVIQRGIYAAMERFGFRGGKMVEGGVGIGNFIGFLPDSMVANSSYVGIERDSITARIASRLYPEAKIHEMGFQDADLQRDQFDASVGNPPFGEQKLTDKRFKEEAKHSIHNYFIAKQLALLRPGGVAGYVVSHYFLDAKDPSARQHIAKSAQFLGAIRLPNTAFKQNANTEVTTDIVFFRKLAPGEQAQENADWVNVGTMPEPGTGKPMTVSSWFVTRPEMMLGKLTLQGSMYAGRDELTLEPTGKDQDLGADLDAAVAQLPANVYRAVEPEVSKRLTDSSPRQDAPSADTTIPADVRVGAYYVTKDGKVMRRAPDVNMERQAQPLPEDTPALTLERIHGLVGVRDAMNALVRAEFADDTAEAELNRLRQNLNKAYDAFTKSYGLLNSISNRRAFYDDPEAMRLLGLETKYDAGVSAAVAKKTGGEPRKPSAEKADIFRQRVNVPYREVTKVATAKEALAVSMNQRGEVDLPYMAELSGLPEAQIIADLDGLMFRNPQGGYETREQYLSGNVRAKLSQAEAAQQREGDQWKANVEALRAVIPADIAPLDIGVPIGAGWVPADVYSRFVADLTRQAPDAIVYRKADGGWLFNHPSSTEESRTRWGVSKDDRTVDFETLFRNLLNARPTIVYDKTDDDKQVVNQEFTTLSAAKSDEIKARWADWIWEDADRRERLARIYNDQFNNYVDPHYDGSHLTLPGANPAIQLRAHQKNVIWRTITERRALYDHVVGAGKTFAGIGAFMEMRRMGRVRKPLFVVPNHLTKQWADEFTKLYPNSNVLFTSPKDFSKENRQKLFAKVLTGEYDAIIIGHSQFKKIGVSPEIERDLLSEMRDEITETIEAMKKAEGKRGSRAVSQAEKTREKIEEKLKKLADGGERDSVATFEELGIDGLFVDEAHEFKNLFYTTQMQRVAGLGDPAGSGKAFDLYLKTRYLHRRFGGKAPLVFATGTPVSNSLVEMFTMQRYLQPDVLADMGLKTLDAWVKVFGDVQQVYEVDPTGTGYRMATRLAQFRNVGEISSIYRTVADVITMSDLVAQAEAEGSRFPVPKVKGGRAQNVVVDRTRDQEAFFGVATQKVNSDGSPAFNADGSPVMEYPPGSILYRLENMPDDPKEDNMLKLTSDARKAGLDMRLVDPNYRDHPGSKVNKAVGSIVDAYKRWNADKGTQLVFCDLSTPLSAKRKARAKKAEAASQFYYTYNGETITPADDAKPAKIPGAPEGLEFFLAKSPQTGKWRVYERSTGRALPGSESTQSAAVTAAGMWIDRIGAQAVRDQIASAQLPAEQIAEARGAWLAAKEAQAAEQEGTGQVDEDGNAIDAGATEINSDEEAALADTSDFSVYDDMKAKLVAAGIPEKEIAFIHDYDTPQAKQKLFDQMNRGEVRVLFGSTPKLGAGTNVQKRLVALHHLDAPWRPSDLEQREGRIIRQGNDLYKRDPDGFEVEVARYATKQTYDTRMWQLLEHKARGIEGFRKADRTTRTVDNVDGEAANAADMKAAASGDPLIQREIELRNDLGKLDLLKRAWSSQRYELQGRVKWLLEADARRDAAVASAQALIAVRQPVPEDPWFMTKADGTRHEGKKGVGEMLAAVAKKVTEGGSDNSFGVYRGFELRVITGNGGSAGTATQIDARPVGSKSPWAEATTFYSKYDTISDTGTIQRLDNYLASFEEKIEVAQKQHANQVQTLAQLNEELARPFAKEAELLRLRDEHAQVKQQLLAGKTRPAQQQGDAPLGTPAEADTRRLFNDLLQDLPDRARDIVRSRMRGESFESIGARYGFDARRAESLFKSADGLTRARVKKAAGDGKAEVAQGSFRTSINLDELKRRFPSYGTKVQATGGNKTQRGRDTVATYQKALPFLGEIKNIFDLSAGDGTGTEWLKKQGIKVESSEPFPPNTFNPTYRNSADAPSGKYDAVINSVVLNVVPQDIRDGIVRDLGRILKPGGRAIVTTRSVSDVMTAADNPANTVISPTEIYVERDTSYQKGFTDAELNSYIQSVLDETYGAGNFTVKSKREAGMGVISPVAVMIQKNRKSSESGPLGTPAERLSPETPVRIVNARNDAPISRSGAESWWKANGPASVTRSDGLTATISGQTIAKITSGNKPYSRVRMALIPHLKELYENAARIDTTDDGRDRDVETIHNLYVPFRHEGKIYPVRLLVKTFKPNAKLPTKFHSARVLDVILENENAGLATNQLGTDVSAPALPGSIPLRLLAPSVNLGTPLGTPAEPAPSDDAAIREHLDGLRMESGLDSARLERDYQKALAEAPGRKTIGDPRLANPGRSDATRSVVNSVDEQRRNTMERESHDLWQAEAEKQIAANFPAVVRDLLERVRGGLDIAANPVAVKAAQLAVERLSREAVESGDAQKLRDAQTLAYAYRVQGSEQARALAARRDPFRTPRQRMAEFFAGILFTPPQPDRKAIEKAWLPREKTRRIQQLTEQADSLRRLLAERERILAEREAQTPATPDVAPAPANPETDATVRRLRARIAEVEAELAGVRKRLDREEKLHDINAKRLQKINRVLSKMGITVADLFAGDAVMRLKGAKIVQNVAAAKNWDATKKRLAKLAAEGWDKASILKKLRLSEEDARRAYEEIRRDVAARLSAFGTSALDAGNLETVVGPDDSATLGTPAEPDQGDEIDPEKAKKIEDMLSAMGLVGWEELDSPVRKARVEQAERRRAEARKQRAKTPRSPKPAPGETITPAPDKNAWADDPDALPPAIDPTNPADATRVVREVQAAEGSGWDMAHEYWINSILSGPLTQAANITGNTLNVAWTLGVKRGLEAAVSDLFLRRATGNANLPHLAEYGRMLRAIIPALSRAWGNAVFAFSTEQSYFSRDILETPLALANDGFDDRDRRSVAIGGKTGRVIRVPVRLLGAVDDFTKTMTASLEAAAHAYRIAKSEGMSGEKMEKRIQGLVNEPGSAAWIAAYESAQRMAFQEEHGPDTFVGRVELGARVARRVPGIRYLVPFVKTPLNIFSQGIRQSPFGSLALLARYVGAMRENRRSGTAIGETFPVEEQLGRAIEQFIAFTIAGMLYGAAAGDDDDEDKQILITGALPEETSGLRSLAQRGGVTPYTLRVGDFQLRYNRIEPLATILGATVDMVTAAKRARNEGRSPALGALAAITTSITAQAENKTMLAGVEAMMEAIKQTRQQQDIGAGAKDWAASFLSGWIPNILRQPVRLADPLVRQPNSTSFPEQVADNIVPQLNQPMADAFGRQVEKGGSALARITIPADIRSRPEMQRVDRLLTNWNQTREDPTDRWAPAPIPGRIKIEGNWRPMTDEERARYATRAGQITANILRSAALNTQKPGEEDIQRIKKAFTTGRQIARREIFGATSADD